MSIEGQTITIPAALTLSYGPGTKFSMEEVTLEPPKGPEVRVKLAATGLCLTDDHVRVGTYDIPWAPCLGGHEASGVITDVGDQVTKLKPGDHVVLSFVPSCGQCAPCQTGHANLCDLGAELFSGVSVYDKSNPFKWNGKGVGQFCQLGTFAPYTVVHQNSAIKISKDIPLDKAALVGCGVATGFGSGAWAAGTQIGDTVVVVGTGGIGMNAVQGARLSGATNIVAVELLEWKRKLAVETFGATHSAASMEEAFELVQKLTHGRMAQRLIYTVSEGLGSDIERALKLVGKSGVMVYTAVADATARDAKIDLFTLTHYEQQIRGALYGSSIPQTDLPRLLSLYMKGELKLDELITKTYTLDQINEGYDDLLAGKNLRGMILFDD